jgi:peptide chain release factor subunit 3
MIHLHTAVESVTVKKLFEEINRKTGQPLKQNPPFIGSNSVARIVLELPRTVALEKFADSPQLGRFILRDEGKTIAMGKIQKIAKADE